MEASDILKRHLLWPYTRRFFVLHFPFFMRSSTQDVSLFQEGFEASDAVKSMAETGSPAALVVSLF